MQKLPFFMHCTLLHRLLTQWNLAHPPSQQKAEYAQFDSVFLATDFYPADLQHIIKSPQKLTDAHVQVKK